MGEIYDIFCWNFVQGKLLKVVSASLDLDVREKSFTDSVK